MLESLLVSDVPPSRRTLDSPRGSPFFFRSFGATCKRDQEKDLPLAPGGEGVPLPPHLGKLFVHVTPLRVFDFHIGEGFGVVDLMLR